MSASRLSGRSARSRLTAAFVALTAAFGTVVGASAAPAAADEPCANGYVALSFDDGPTTLTPDYVQALHDAGWVRATFFLTGANALDHPSYVDLLAQNGHWIGNHTYSHPFLDTLSSTDVFNELLGTNQILLSQTGVAPTLFRPPYGRTDSTIRGHATTLGMTETLWTTDSLDYNGITAAQITANALTVAPGGIILLHEGYQTTLDALPDIISGLADRGLCAGKIVPSEDPVEAWPGTTFYAVAAHW
ncbi:peptidoglycan/xylan/chitin deacetylase (PgdA/CDA1 family) [Actinocorallia herbida]|uniref:Peptidoglycan/xylan/chitin deacetylase (PgdA/CDA1 family) n=1 Tax=Actinocorallia herbida TaxID=58109 RepID=A0A3N1D505_9ACTN|nr:polysaccharide deacetylase family protein [Actinocorallia herbida]ROO88633.1 peptidoglycan/xylan/chitin deacetylase (PgdA/CDA1 family) [Actinocorallia herbida]